MPRRPTWDDVRRNDRGQFAPRNPQPAHGAGALCAIASALAAAVTAAASLFSRK